VNSRAYSFWNLLFITGSACLLFALYQVYLTATEPACVVGSEHDGCSLLVTFSPSDVIVEIIFQGVLFSVAAGIVLLGVWSKQARKMYGSLQAAVWLVGLTLWFQGSHHLDPFPVDSWATFGLTGLCSLALFAVHRPLTHVFARWMGKLQTTSP
jgi:hypothetical protein